MEITVREFRSEDTKDAIAIWNEVEIREKHFHSLRVWEWKMEKHFLRNSLIQVLRSMKMMRSSGLYILHPNNVGRCGHICNASYAVKSTVRGARRW